METKALSELPKRDVHNHVVFGYHLRQLESWAKVRIQRFKGTTQGIRGLYDYYSRHILPLIRTRSGFEFCVNATIEAAISDNVKHLEASIDCRAIEYFGESGDKLAMFLGGICSQYKSQIRFLPELGLSRMQAIEELRRQATVCIDTGAFYSLDLYGPGEDREPEDYVAIYEYARKKGIKLKAHLAEFGGASSLPRVAEMLQLNEIQHGIHAVDDVRALDYLASNGIRLNLSPVSNFMTGSCGTRQQYPIGKLRAHGVQVSLNTDDLLLFGATVTDNYMALVQRGELSYSDACWLCRGSPSERCDS